MTVEDLRKRAATTKTPDFSALGNVKVIDRTGPQAKYLHGRSLDLHWDIKIAVKSAPSKIIYQISN